MLDRLPLETRQLVRKQNEIADRIYRALKQRNITQKEFAQQLGMKESQLCKILSGNANLTLKTIVKIEIALKEEIVQVVVLPAKCDHGFKIESDYRQNNTFPAKHSYAIPSVPLNRDLVISRAAIAEARVIYGDA